MSDLYVEIEVDPARARVYEHGWQSWSPTAAYRVGERPARPVSRARRAGNYRPERVAPADAFWGEGLLAIDPGTGAGVHVVAARSPGGSVPSLRADVTGGRVVVTCPDGAAADGTEAAVDDVIAPEGLDLQEALAWWADRFVAVHGPARLVPPPTVWCSWYHYFTKVTQADIEENLAAIDDLGLDVDVVQIDDGWQAEIGDWLTLSDRFRSLPSIVERIHGHGRRAGIWVAPFFLGGRSATLREHPDWVIRGADPGEGWDQPLAALDVTNPAAEAHLRMVFGSLAATGIDYFKIDFLFAGAMEGRRADASVSGVDAYRHGLSVIREAIGPDAYLLGCGAPQLPSVGLVDGMRVGPDIARHVEPVDGDLSQPSQRAAAANSRARAWMHGRFWVNDADCLIAGAHVERREDWARVIEGYSGLRASSDRLRGLDPWGLETTRRLLRRGIVEPFVR
jgi:alpha-galactosidase